MSRSGWSGLGSFLAAKARADKVDRNKNGFVCRKDLPGRGTGNTGQISNTKADEI